LNVVVHPADIQNRDGGCAGRYDCFRSIERILPTARTRDARWQWLQSSFIRLATIRIMIRRLAVNGSL
jgi:hypothetical protein